MSTEVLVPELGAEERSPLIAEWYLPDGAEVRPGDAVYRIETDFVAIDIEAEADGVLRHWIAAGESRPTGHAVAVIFKPGELEDEGEVQDDAEALEEPEAIVPRAAFEALVADRWPAGADPFEHDDPREPIPFVAAEALEDMDAGSPGTGSLRQRPPGAGTPGDAPVAAEDDLFEAEVAMDDALSGLLVFPAPEPPPANLIEFPTEAPAEDEDEEAKAEEPEDERLNLIDGLEFEVDQPAVGDVDVATDDADESEPDSWASAMSSWAHSRKKVIEDEEEAAGEAARPIPLILRGLLPVAPPAEAGSAWDSVPGDRQDFSGAWEEGEQGRPHDDLRAALASAESEWEEIEPPVKHPSAPVSPDLAEMAPLLMRERPAHEPFWMPDTHPGGPVTLTLKVVVRMTEARKMREQLGREWRTAGVNPSDDDILIRALARASMEDDILKVRGDAIGLVLAEATEERVAILDNASRGPFRDRVEALSLARVTEREGGCSATVTSFGHFGLDEGTPPLPEGHPYALGAGAIRVIFEAGDVPAPMMTLVLAYTPELIAVGRAARLLSRIRELLEAPYALFAD